MISGALLLGGIGFLLSANAMATKLMFIQLVPAMVLKVLPHMKWGWQHDCSIPFANSVCHSVS